MGIECYKHKIPHTTRLVWPRLPTRPSKRFANFGHYHNLVGLSFAQQHNPVVPIHWQSDGLGDSTRCHPCLSRLRDTIYNSCSSHSTQILLNVVEHVSYPQPWHPVAGPCGYHRPWKSHQTWRADPTIRDGIGPTRTIADGDWRQIHR